MLHRWRWADPGAAERQPLAAGAHVAPAAMVSAAAACAACGFDPLLAKALSHPLRQQLLGAYMQRVASPSELAVEFGRPVNEVAYHTKRLAELGFIELVRTERGPWSQALL